jgi:hypothetical protein
MIGRVVAVAVSASCLLVGCSDLLRLGDPPSIFSSQASDADAQQAVNDSRDVSQDTTIHDSSSPSQDGGLDVTVLDESDHAGDAEAAVDASHAQEASDATDGHDEVEDVSVDAMGDEEVVLEAASDAPPSPPTVASSHLRLWLTAKTGITCTSGRVTNWADQSQNHDDALPQNNQLGPQCQISASPHLLNGIDLPSFSAPTANGNIIDETLDVNLAFLANSNYTIFAVERRWADYPTGYEFVLGTTVPLALEVTWPGCGPSSANKALAFGYVYYNGGPQFTLDQVCNTLWATVVGSVLPPPPIAPSEETALFDVASGHKLWVSGFPVVANADTNPLAYAGGGAIGRSVDQTPASTDPRFRGDIAEVIVYDAALSDSDRLTVEAYLKDFWKY